MPLAISPLPVPVSPSMRTVALVGAPVLPGQVSLQRLALADDAAEIVFQVDLRFKYI